VRNQPTYQFDRNMIVQPTEASPRINFDELKDVLLSVASDANLERYNSMVSDKPKFLDSKVNMSGNRVAFASYPRSGNSFLRKMIEQITGVFTGSDVPMKDCLPL